jgi:hypothetical protein
MLAPRRRAARSTNHADAAFWLGVVLPAIVVAAAITIRCPTGRWAWARFVPMAAWASYLLVVIVTSRHGQELYPEPVGLSTRAAVPSPGSV